MNTLQNSRSKAKYTFS